MTKIKWVKQLTRENTLLDRSLRVLAYRDSVAEIGKANMSNVLIVGKGQVTSLYYLSDDYKKHQQIIAREFKGKRIEEMGQKILLFLEEGYTWAKKLKSKQLTKKEFIEYYKNFNKHHAHSRGAIVYGYWGEPGINAKLKKILQKKVAKKDLDHTLSLVSSPKTMAGALEELRSHSISVEKEKDRVLKKLNLSKQEQEIVEILSWFTLFYEIGELVSSYLYDQFLDHLRKLVGSKKEFEELMWYDPNNLKDYLKGKKLSKKELLQRKNFWIIELINEKWKLLSGEKAHKYRNQYLPKEKINSTSEIKGTIACLGKVFGEVKIIITQEDQGKMNNGDILVSPMTTPRLMAAVKKAAAIVTDEGGMTAHAAIVSREFNIPCIVGTKIATKVLKDGDQVEVDATKGIIKKI